MATKQSKGQHARLNDESDDEASAKKALEFAELTFRINKCGVDTLCYLDNVPTELRSDRKVA